MKKIVSLVLTLCMLVACAMTFTPVYADGEDLIVKAGEVTGDVGDTVVLPIYVKSAEVLTQVKISLTYNDKALKQTKGELATITGVTLLSQCDNGSVGSAYKSGNYVIIGVLSGTLQPADFEPVYYATFEIIGDEPEYPIALAIEEEHHAGSTSAVVNGKIKVSAIDNSTEIQAVYNEDSEKMTVTVPATAQGAISIPSKKVEKITVKKGASIDKLILTDSVEEIGNKALTGWSGDIYLMGNAVIGNQAFGYKYDDSEDGYVQDCAVVLHGWSNSNAQEYANKVGGTVTFEKLEEFEHAGLQQGAAGNENAFRYISRMKYAEEYKNAKVVITVSGKLGGVDITGKNPKTVSINSVFKKLDNAYGEEKVVADGYYYSAINIKGLPTMGVEDYIDFTYTTSVTNPCDSEVVTDTFTVRYTVDGAAELED